MTGGFTRNIRLRFTDNIVGSQYPRGKGKQEFTSTINNARRSKCLIRM